MLSSSEDPKFIPFIVLIIILIVNKMSMDGVCIERDAPKTQDGPPEFTTILRRIKRWVFWLGK